MSFDMLCPTDSQNGFGTNVPETMAKSVEHEDTAVLLERKDFLAKLAEAIHPPIAEESKSRRNPSG